MRAKSFLVVAGYMIVTACGPHEPKDSDKPSPVATTGDTKRNAAFWKEVASVHFKEDRSHAGEPLPAAELADEAGEPTMLAAMRGKPVFVNFWAHWCVPCRAEMPTIDAMATERAAAIQVTAVNEDVMRPSSRSLGELRMAPSITRLIDKKGALAKTVAGAGLPTSVLYGSDGRERWRLVGVLDWTKPQARKLLEEAL